MQKAVQIQQPAVEKQCATASVNMQSLALLSTVSQEDDSDWFQCGKESAVCYTFIFFDYST